MLLLAPSYFRSYIAWQVISTRQLDDYDVDSLADFEHGHESTVHHVASDCVQFVRLHVARGFRHERHHLWSGQNENQGYGWFGGDQRIDTNWPLLFAVHSWILRQNYLRGRARDHDEFVGQCDFQPAQSVVQHNSLRVRLLKHIYLQQMHMAN